MREVIKDVLMDGNTNSDTGTSLLPMSEQRFPSNSVRTVTEDCRNNTVSTTHVNSLTSSAQSLHPVCTISTGWVVKTAHILTEPLKLSSLQTSHQHLIPSSAAQENLSSSTYDIEHHNGSVLSTQDSNNSSVIWVDNKNSEVNLVSLTSGQELSRDTKLKNRAVHTPITSLHSNVLINENQDALMNAYISRSLPEILVPESQDAVGVHNLSEPNQVQLDSTMNAVQNSQTHLITLSEDKGLNTGLLLNNTNLSATSYDKSNVLNMSNVYSVAPSQASTSLRSHALTLDTSVHTQHSTMVRTNEYEQHSHVGNSNLVNNRDINNSSDNAIQVRGVTIMNNMDMTSSAGTHLQHNDILANECDSLHLSSVDLSSNMLDQMNNLNHLSGQESSCENLKMDCLIETLPCYRCKVCPFLSLSRVGIEHHLRSAHPKLLAINSPEVHNSEPLPEKSEAMSSSIQRPQEVNSVMGDTTALSKDVTFICGMCDKVFPYIESCSAHMAVEHNIPADNVQLEPMNQTSLPVHNLIPSPAILTHPTDQHHQHQTLPSLLPSLRPKISLVTATSTFMSTCQTSQPVTTSAPTKRAKFAPRAKTVVAAKQTQSAPAKSVTKNKAQTIKSEVVAKRSQSDQNVNEMLTDDSSSTEVDKKTENSSEGSTKNSSKKRGRPRGSKGAKVVAAKKVPNRGKSDNQKDTRFRCEVTGCAIRMRSMDNMEYHTRSHVENGFVCPECREKFDNWKTMSIHLWRIHVVDMELYTCDICNYKTYSYGKLINMHRRIHSEDRPFLCDTCGKGFKTSKQLRNHRVIHLDKRKHRNLRSGECDICHRRFSDRRMLRVHNDTVHSKLRPYLCSYCGYAASCRSTLKMHIRQHTGEKPFACEKCEYRTADHNSLRRHKMRHSGEKPYRCPFCPYACIQSSTYKTHLKNKHPGMDEGLMFCCSQCSFRTIKKENFITHMVDHKMGSGNKWTMDNNAETSGNISTNSTDVKLEEGCTSFLSSTLSQQESVPVTLQSHLEGIPQYVYSVQEDINHGVTHQVITMDNDNAEERFPILAGQLKLGHLSEVNDVNTVQMHSSSQMEIECNERLNIHVVEESVSGSVRDRVHISDSNLHGDELPPENAAHKALGHMQLVTLNPLSPTSILPDTV